MSFYLSNATKGTVLHFSYPCKENKHECYPLKGKFPPGIFLLELYGAEGGQVNDHHGGKGGYSRGILTTYHYIDAFLYIGAQGETTTNELSSTVQRSFGGGGSAKQSPNLNNYASAGGGASDIRLFKDDIFHRVIVAGGGGGTGSFDSDYSSGGDGGGLSGGSATRFSCSPSENYAGEGGQQEGTELFGEGGDIAGNACGGCGGWYGGQGGFGYNNPGGGGSGFVFNITNKGIADKAGLDLPESVFLVSSDTTSSDHYGDGFIQITIIELLKITCSSSKTFPRIFTFILLFIQK